MNELRALSFGMQPGIFISVPFEIDALPTDRIAHVFARGHLSVEENRLTLVYHRFTPMLEMEQHETFSFEWLRVKRAVLRMSLFSARLILELQPGACPDDFFGYKNDQINLIIPRAYRDEARAAADRIQRECSRIAG